MAGTLTIQEINELRAKARQKGRYIACLNEFYESGDPGVSVSEKWPEFAGKKAMTVKQGFDNAKKNKEAAEGTEHIDTLTNDGQVYLLRSDVVEAA